MRVLSYFIRAGCIVGVYLIYSGIHHFMIYSSMVQYAKMKGSADRGRHSPLSDCCSIVAGASFLLGYQTDIGVAALVVFLIPVSCMMHNFGLRPARKGRPTRSTFSRTWRCWARG